MILCCWYFALFASFFLSLGHFVNLLERFFLYSERIKKPCSQKIQNVSKSRKKLHRERETFQWVKKKSGRNSTPFDPIIFGSLFIGFCLEKYYFSAPWRQTWSLNHFLAIFFHKSIFYVPALSIQTLPSRFRYLSLNYIKVLRQFSIRQFEWGLQVHPLRFPNLSSLIHPAQVLLVLPNSIQFGATKCVRYLDQFNLLRWLSKRSSQFGQKWPKNNNFATLTKVVLKSKIHLIVVRKCLLAELLK